MDNIGINYNKESASGLPAGVAAGSLSATAEPKFNHLFSELTPEVRHDLISYINGVGAASSQNMLVIPATKHYYYDEEDMAGVNSVVSLRQLNHIKELRNFLKKISEMLPDGSLFIGCFVDNSMYNGFSIKYSNLPKGISDKAEAYENGIESRIPFINRMYSFIDMKTNRYLTSRTVTSLLLESGLELGGMIEMNGLTYFHTRRRARQVSLIA